MLRADLAAEISANSYIPTFVPVSSTCPGPHPLRLSVRAETRRGAQWDLDLAAEPGVGMFECTNPAPSSFPKPSIRPRETRIFVHSYVLTLTADRRRLVRSACTAAFYCLIGLAVAAVCTTTRIRYNSR